MLDLGEGACEIFIGRLQIVEDIGFNNDSCEIIFAIGLADVVDAVFLSHDLRLRVDWLILGKHTVFDSLFNHLVKFLNLVIPHVEVLDLVIFDDEVLNWFVLAFDFFVEPAEILRFFHIDGLMIDSPEVGIS